ncbi:hypothetical protein BDW74DRAFT_145321 [Aspergillus multicolor]|uniref:uncharacterized protein n=1 Tax=Aspergillus multicolor TaxID=41759 RepID=UPI003CCDE386
MDAMAEAVIRQKTKSKKSPGVFRFFDLPVELQYRVLEYTNLVLDRRFSYDCLRGTFIPPFICDTYSRNPRKDFCTGRAAIPCLRTPHMLFLVNNAMRQLATAVFYSRNSFKIKPRLRECAPAAAWSAEQSEFIQGFPKRSFPYLRHIRWKFDNNFSGNWAYFLPGSKEVEDWVISLYLISLVVPPGVLKIEITMYSFGCSNLTAETQRHEDNDGAYYDRVIGPMDCLKGRLKDLFIQISYPRCSPWDEIRRDRERQLERRIMGSDYDSFARGKKLNDEEAWWCDFGLT